MANPSSQSPIRVVGDVADNGVDSGNPVKVGGVYNTTTPTYADGDRADFQLGARGAVDVTVYGKDGTASATVSTLADGSTNTLNAMAIRSYAALYNGSTWDRSRGNVDGTALASAARTAAATSADIVNYNGIAIRIVCDVTVDPASASITFGIQFKDVLSGVYQTQLVSAAITATGTTSMVIHPAIAFSANVKTGLPVTRIFRIITTHVDSDSITYSIGYSLMVA